MSPQGACRKPNALYVRMNECTKFGKRFCHYKLIIASFIKISKKNSQEKHWWYVSEHSLCCFTRVHDFSLHASQKLHGHGKIDRKAGRHTHKQTHRLNYRPRLINTYICCLFLWKLVRGFISDPYFHIPCCYWTRIAAYDPPSKKKKEPWLHFKLCESSRLSVLCAIFFGLSQQSFTIERGQRVGCDQHQDV